MVILLFTVQNFCFIFVNTEPPYADSPHHIALSHYYYRILFAKNLPIYSSELFSKYPFLTYTVTALFYKLFGISTKVALASLYVFSLIFIISLFLAGYYLGEEWGAVVATSIGVSCNPFIQLSHLYLLDMPQAAIIALSIYTLLKTERFKNTKYSYLFGFTLGLSLVTKWNSIFYIGAALVVYGIYILLKKPKIWWISLLYLLASAIPLLFIYQWGLTYYMQNNINIPSKRFTLVFYTAITILFASIFILQRIKKIQRDEDIACLNFTKSLILALLVSGGWYVYNIWGVYAKIGLQMDEMKHAFPEGERSLFTYSIKSYMLYFTRMLFILFYGYFLVGILFSLIKRERFLENMSLLIMGISGVLCVSYLAPPTVFYVLPTVITIALLGGWWLKHTSLLKVPLAILPMMYAVAFLMYPISPQIYTTLRTNPIADRVNLLMTEETMPKKDNYKIEDIVYTIHHQKNIVQNDKDLTVVITYMTGSFRRGPHRFEISQDVLLVKARELGFYEIITKQAWDLEEIKRNIEENSLFTIFIAIGYTKDEEIKKIIKEIEEHTEQKVKIIKTYNMPSNTKGAILRLDPEWE